MTFTGGDKLMARLQAMADKLGRADEVQTGFLEGNTYPDGLNVAQAAFWSEYGTKSSPPRPFFRNAIKVFKPTIGEVAAKVAKAADYDARLILGRMGEYMAGGVQESIIKLYEPRLSQLTIAIRQYQGPMRTNPITGTKIGELAAQLRAGELDLTGVSTKPLVYTGTTLRYVAWQIRGEADQHLLG